MSQLAQVGLNVHISNFGISHVSEMVKIELTSFNLFLETKVVLKCLTNIFMGITCLLINLDHLTLK